MRSVVTGWVRRYPGSVPSSGHALRTLHLLEEHGHRARVVAGRDQSLQAGAVGVALEVAGVRELGGGRGPLHRDARAAGEVGPGAPEEQRRRHGREHRQLHLLLLSQHARDVALRDVRELVREHRGELRLGVGRGEQPGVHARRSRPAARTR
jgi:hypothetical protein